MRNCLFFLLAIMLSLNASYAASVGVCDAMEHTSDRAAHFGHHSHEHSDAHAHNDLPASFDVTGDTSSVSDRCHNHVHPSFSYILPNIIGVMPLAGNSQMVAAPADALISVPQTPPARPPRATLA